MKEELNELLIKIKYIALEKDMYDIIKYVDEISELLGDDYEIYKLENDD